MIRILCFVAVAFVTLMLIIAWLDASETRSEELNRYNDCVMRNVEGTSIPLKDGWIIFNEICNQN